MSQEREYSEQYEATDRINKSFELAGKEYMKHLKLARVALEGNRGIEVKLGLKGPREKATGKWLVQGRQFYENALADALILGKLSSYGVTLENLQAGLALVNEVERLYRSRERERGEAQDSTVLHDELFEKLDSWYSDFVKVARIALEERPQLIEKLGILERSEK